MTEDHKVNLPLYVTVEGQPYMRGDVCHDLLDAARFLSKFYKKSVDVGPMSLNPAREANAWRMLHAAVEKADGAG